MRDFLLYTLYRVEEYAISIYTVLFRVKFEILFSELLYNIENVKKKIVYTFTFCVLHYELVENLLAIISDGCIKTFPKFIITVLLFHHK